VTYVITGATGHLGRLVVEALLQRGVPAKHIVATGRDIGRVEDLADRGVHVRPVDYNDPDTLREAFTGADKVLLVSGSEVGQRVAQHQNAIDAAKATGVGLLAYTSIANADRTGMQLAADHQATEEALAEADVPYTLLRNSWYLENYTDQLPTHLAHGSVLGSAGKGRVSAATRADYAEAAAAVLATDGHAGKTYELGGEAFTMTELAQAISEVTGHTVTYRDLATDEYTQVLVQAGVPEPFAAVLADSDLGIARGDLLVPTKDLMTLLGRPATSMPEAIRATAATAGTAT
jgi:NAD(P)H dehydrogenase (quinone)